MRGIKDSGLHGTRNRYTSGCRCDPCRIAATAYRRSRYEAERRARPSRRRGLIEPPPHRGPLGLPRDLAVAGFTPLEEAILIDLAHCEESPLFGAYIPPRIFTNTEIGEIFGVTPQAISLSVSVSLNKLRDSKLRNWQVAQCG